MKCLDTCHRDNMPFTLVSMKTKVVDVFILLLHQVRRQLRVHPCCRSSVKQQYQQLTENTGQTLSHYTVATLVLHQQKVENIQYRVLKSSKLKTTAKLFYGEKRKIFYTKLKKS